MRFGLWGVVICGAGLVGGAVELEGQGRGHPVLAARIDSVVETMREADGTPGITIAVVRGSDTIALRGYGLAEVEHSVPTTPRSVFHIASVTKQFTAAAVMKLVEAGRLDLEGTVGDYLPEYEGPAVRVTLHQLLTHTGGVPNYTDLGARLARPSRLDQTHEEMVALWAAEPLAFEPGSGWAYSNSGYYLLGMIIERVTGSSYADHMRRELWDPLGLDQTYYCAQRDIIPHRAQAYGLRNGELFNAPPFSMSMPFASGALCSTPRDLVRWTRALHGGRVVSPESFRRMAAPVELNDGTTHPYGYGLRPERLGDVAVIQHGGGMNGFSANLAHYPEHDLTIAVIVNGPTSSSTLAQRIAYMALDIPDPDAVDLPTTAAERARYVGTYDFAPADYQMRIVETAGRLFAEVEGSSPIPLRYQGEHTFRGPPGSDIVIVFTMTGDRATGLTLPQNGGLTARRIDPQEELPRATSRTSRSP